MALWSRVEQSSAKSSGVEQSGAAKSILPLRKSGKRFAILFHLAFFFRRLSYFDSRGFAFCHDFAKIRKTVCDFISSRVFFLGVSHILILGGLLFVTILRKSRLRLDFPLPLEDSSSSSSSLLLSLLLPPSSHPLPSFFPPSSFFSLLLTLPFFPSPSSSLAAFCFA